MELRRVRGRGNHGEPRSDIKALCSFLIQVTESGAMVDVLDALLTKSEVESLNQRVAILDLLSRGVSQREIAETLGVGIATVTRGSRTWQDHRAALDEHFPVGQEKAENQKTDSP